MLSNILKKNDGSSGQSPVTPTPSSRTFSSASETTTPSYLSTPINPTEPVKDVKQAATGRTVTVLTAETEFHGTLGFSGDLEIYGRLEGAIESDSGLLTIGESALIKAAIRAQNIVIYGKVQGDIVASGRIEFRGKAQIYGDVKSGRLLIEDGVTFVGRSESINQKSEEKPDFGNIFNKLTPPAESGSSAKSSLK